MSALLERIAVALRNGGLALRDGHGGGHALRAADPTGPTDAGDGDDQERPCGTSAPTTGSRGLDAGDGPLAGLIDHYRARRRHWAGVCELRPPDAPPQPALRSAIPPLEPPTLGRLDDSRAAAACQRAGLLADQVASLAADLDRTRGTLGRVTGRRDELARALSDADRCLLWADQHHAALAAGASGLSARLRELIGDYPDLRVDGRLLDVLNGLADFALGHGPAIAAVRDRLGRALVHPAPTERTEQPERTESAP
jgi:hypothetical protein